MMLWLPGDIRQKLEAGDALTDAELDTALKFYEQMENGLYSSGTKFHIAWEPVMQMHRKLKSIKRK